jgi:hypothetical protein
MLAACICMIAYDRKAYPEYIRSLRHPFSPAGIAFCVAAGIIILVCAYFTAAGKFAYDTGTYHAQSIHWIESFGVVKGLAYMQTRLGFNSSYFYICALFSMHFLGQSMHTLSGFLAVFVMLYSLSGWCRNISGSVKRHKDNAANGSAGVIRSTAAGTVWLHVSDFAYPAPFAYFIIIAAEIISPSTDHGVIWLIIWLCIRWLEVIEKEIRDRQNGYTDEGTEAALSEYSLLSVMAVFLVSVKLSVGVLALLVIRPAFVLIRERRAADIIKYIAAGLVLVLPFFIRNVLITGWLVYPFPAIDLFNPDWKIPADGVRYEADEIVVWARYTKDTKLIDQSIGEWFPVWWSEQGAANRYLSISAFAGAAVIALRAAAALIYSLYLWLNGKRGRLIAIAPGVKDQSSYVYFGLIILLSFAFFMVSAPSNRFGYGYIIMIPLFAAGDVIVNIVARLGLKWPVRAAISAAVMIMICLDLLKGLYMFASDDRHFMADNGPGPVLVRQKDYPQADAGSKEWEGMEIFYPVIEGDQIWYHAFPAILYEGNLDGIERRGSNMRDGFRLKNSGL